MNGGTYIVSRRCAQCGQVFSVNGRGLVYRFLTDQYELESTSGRVVMAHRCEPLTPQKTADAPEFFALLNMASAPDHE